MTDTLRRIATILAALTVFAVSSLPTAAAVRHCSIKRIDHRSCPQGQHCVVGVNPHGVGICVANKPKT